MYSIYSGNESDDDPIYTEMLEYICDGSKSHLNVDRRKSRYKICDSIKQRQSERKGAFTATRSMGKGLQKVFKTVLKDISQDLTPLGESGSEVSHFILERKNFAEVTKLSDDINKPWLNTTQKEIKNLINNLNFLVEDPKKDEPVTPCMDVYKAKVQSDGSIDKLKLRIGVRGEIQNKEPVGDTWSPTASMRT